MDLIWIAVGLVLVIGLVAYLYRVGIEAGKRHQAEIDDMEFEARLADERKRGVR